uniref:Uncharacterized protein n=1 Tax=Chromera velia CCMP2878 TaxID=1169474 RepID=A0A0G4HEP4_9ALVE|eukprot:Cvel_6580.t1-p1 / transcript=Cvel_6580.t1 / gene=Cvel_6580 / organism=Chromera_velia_CCMP2878 / gene_product=hypothetical protein / transcript_product=hypothetical protein / location=Cvel_scaffold324:80731-86008(-) / protein_length=1286 / sequence_SO=supercontig / SO=protein_coding / is_pseudo=false
MNKSPALANKICARRWEEHKDKIHKKKLRSIRPTIDHAAPKPFTLLHMQFNAKKEEQLEQKYIEIDRQNRILLNRMYTIMKKPSYSQPPAIPPGAPAISKTSSLNKPFRRKKMEEITQNNVRLLGRIQKTQPVYNHVDWQRHSESSYKYYRNAAQTHDSLYAERTGKFELCPHTRARLRLAPIPSVPVNMNNAIEDRQRTTGSSWNSSTDPASGSRTDREDMGMTAASGIGARLRGKSRDSGGASLRGNSNLWPQSQAPPYLFDEQQSLPLSSLNPKRPAAQGGARRPGSAGDGVGGETGDEIGVGEGGAEKRDGTKQTRGKQRFVFKEGRRINGKFFLIEMTSTQKTLRILAYDGEDGRCLELLVPHTQHMQLLQKHRNSYESICRHLAISSDTDCPPTTKSGQPKKGVPGQPVLYIADTPQYVPERPISMPYGGGFLAVPSVPAPPAPSGDSKTKHAKTASSVVARWNRRSSQLGKGQQDPSALQPGKPEIPAETQKEGENDAKDKEEQKEAEAEGEKGEDAGEKFQTDDDHDDVEFEEATRDVSRNLAENIINDATRESAAAIAGETDLDLDLGPDNAPRPPAPLGSFGSQEFVLHISGTSQGSASQAVSLSDGLGILSHQQGGGIFATQPEEGAEETDAPLPPVPKETDEDEQQEQNATEAQDDKTGVAEAESPPKSPEEGENGEETKPEQPPSPTEPADIFQAADPASSAQQQNEEVEGEEKESEENKPVTLEKAKEAQRGEEEEEEEGEGVKSDGNKDTEKKSATPPPLPVAAEDPAPKSDDEPSDAQNPVRDGQKEAAENEKTPTPPAEKAEGAQAEANPDPPKEAEEAQKVTEEPKGEADKQNADQSEAVAPSAVSSKDKAEAPAEAKEEEKERAVPAGEGAELQKESADNQKESSQSGLEKQADQPSQQAEGGDEVKKEEEPQEEKEKEAASGESQQEQQQQQEQQEQQEQEDKELEDVALKIQAAFRKKKSRPFKSQSKLAVAAPAAEQAEGGEEAKKEGEQAAEQADSSEEPKKDSEQAPQQPEITEEEKKEHGQLASQQKEGGDSTNENPPKVQENPDEAQGDSKEEKPDETPKEEPPSDPPTETKDQEGMPEGLPAAWGLAGPSQEEEGEKGAEGKEGEEGSKEEEAQQSADAQGDEKEEKGEEAQAEAEKDGDGEGTPLGTVKLPAWGIFGSAPKAEGAPAAEGGKENEQEKEADTKADVSASPAEVEGKEEEQEGEEVEEERKGEEEPKEEKGAEGEEGQKEDLVPPPPTEEEVEKTEEKPSDQEEAQPAS